MPYTTRPSGVLQHIWANAYGAGLGLLFVVASVGSLLADDSSRSSVARAAAQGSTDELWNAFFGIGGLLILVGLIRRRPNVEGAGLICTIFGLLVAIGSVIAVIGITGQSRFALATYLALVFGQSGRLAWLVHCARHRTSP